MTKFFVLVAIGVSLGSWLGPARADVQTVFLKQTVAAKLADQRLVGNVRAQAKREGVIVDVPELFIYYSDFSPAYHLSGDRPTLTRELDLVINARRMERSMVRMDRLLERAVRPDGAGVSADDLPVADFYVFLYRTEDCAVCDAVESALQDWLVNRSETASWILVSLD